MSCTITVPAGGLVIDLGARRLVIAKTLTVAGPAGAGLTITSASDVTVRKRALLDVKAGIAAGAIHLEALGGSVTFGGRSTRAVPASPATAATWCSRRWTA